MKTRVDELAILGGSPEFREPVLVGRPNVGDRARLLARIEAMLDRRWFSNQGPMVRELEERLGERLGVRNVVAVCNATVGLELAVRALGWKGEAIVPSYTFVASAHALTLNGVRPVFCDVDPRTHCVDPAEVDRLVGPDTTGILAVHLWGRPCDTGALARIARDRGLGIVYDAAHAFGSGRGGRLAGGWGDVEVFSFHATKFFNAFEGGALTTGDDGLAQVLRELRSFGGEDDDIHRVGTNAKMPEVCAAMGLTGLESLEAFIEQNRRNDAAWRRAVDPIPGLSLMAWDDVDPHNHQYVVLELGPDYPLDRSTVRRVLEREHVFTKSYFHPCHRLGPYRGDPLRRPVPVTERLSETVLVLPTGSAVSTDDIAAIGRILALAAEAAEAIRASS